LSCSSGRAPGAPREVRPRTAVESSAGGLPSDRTSGTQEIGHPAAKRTRLVQARCVQRMRAAASHPVASLPAHSLATAAAPASCHTPHSAPARLIPRPQARRGRSRATCTSARMSTLKSSRGAWATGAATPPWLPRWLIKMRTRPSSSCRVGGGNKGLRTAVEHGRHSTHATPPPLAPFPGEAHSLWNAGGEGGGDLLLEVTYRPAGKGEAMYETLAGGL
jgi:hypothetical protein